MDILRDYMSLPNISPEEFSLNFIKYLNSNDLDKSLSIISDFADNKVKFKLANFLYDDYKLLKKTKQIRNLSGDELEQALIEGMLASGRMELSKRSAKGYLALKSEDEDAILLAKVEGSIDDIYINGIEIAKQQAKQQRGSADYIKAKPVL